jgi:hypothetical protein
MNSGRALGTGPLKAPKATPHRKLSRICCKHRPPCNAAITQLVVAIIWYALLQPASQGRRVTVPPSRIRR